jgi:hypothetical protein
VPSPDKSGKILISRKLSSGFPAKFSFLKKTFPRKFLPEVPYQEACPINQQAKENWYRKKSIVIPVQCLYK